MVKTCGVEMVWHATFDFFSQFSGCCDDAVGRGDSQGYEMFVFVETVAETRVVRLSFIHMVQAR